MSSGEVVRIEAAEIEREVWDARETTDARAIEIGLRPATDEELLAAMLCSDSMDSIVMSREIIAQATENMAKQIFVDEYERRLVEGVDYQPPIIVPLLNGGARFAHDLTGALATFAADIPGQEEPFLLDLDPVLVNPSMYKDAQTPGNGTFEKGYTQEERERMSGRHVIFVDDGIDRGGTVRFTREETIELLTGPMAVNEYADDGKTIVDIRVVPLKPPASVRVATLWVKLRATEQPDYVGGHIDDDWVNGYGCNMMLPNGDSVGRNIPFIARSIQQPE